MTDKESKLHLLSLKEVTQYCSYYLVLDNSQKTKQKTFKALRTSFVIIHIKTLELTQNNWKTKLKPIVYCAEKKKKEIKLADAERQHTVKWQQKWFLGTWKRNASQEYRPKFCMQTSASLSQRFTLTRAGNLVIIKADVRKPNHIQPDTWNLYYRKIYIKHYADLNRQTYLGN